MLTAKSAVDNERQKLFNEIRHLVGSAHQVPAHLSFSVLCKMLWAMHGREDILEELGK